MKQVTQRPVLPAIESIGPVWHHDHGTKMGLLHVDSERGVVLLGSSAASVQIFRMLKEVLIEWTVEYSPISWVRGRITMSLTQLATAFDIPCVESPLGLDCSQWILDLFGGDRAIQGCFIGYQEFLSIPGPGTGHDGDPNVSIMISPQIRDAVKQILD